MTRGRKKRPRLFPLPATCHSSSFFLPLTWKKNAWVVFCDVVNAKCNDGSNAPQTQEQCVMTFTRRTSTNAARAGYDSGAIAKLRRWFIARRRCHPALFKVRALQSGSPTSPIQQHSDTASVSCRSNNGIVVSGSNIFNHTQLLLFFGDAQMEPIQSNIALTYYRVQYNTRWSRIDSRCERTRSV